MNLKKVLKNQLAVKKGKDMLKVKNKKLKKKKKKKEKQNQKKEF